MADPLADYLFGQINTPQAFTGAMENLGFQGTPFGGVNQSYADVENFQRSLKRILDLQLGAFNQGNNVNALPANLRGMFNAAAPIMTDPAWGIIGAPGMFSNGYQMGELPGNRTMAHQQFWDRNNAPPPIIPPPAPVAAPQNVSQAVAAPQMNSGSNRSGGTQSYSVGLQGGGTMTVNANSPAAALANVQAQGGAPQQGQVSVGGHQTFPNVPPPAPIVQAPKPNQQSGSAFKMGFK